MKNLLPSAAFASPGPAQATSNVCITLPDVLELLPEWEGEVKNWSCQVLHTSSGQQGNFIPLRTTYINKNIV